MWVIIWRNSGPSLGMGLPWSLVRSREEKKEASRMEAPHTPRVSDQRGQHRTRNRRRDMKFLGLTKLLSPGRRESWSPKDMLEVATTRGEAEPSHGEGEPREC